MMKINDIIDKIYEQCFGEDLRQLLEFTSNNYKITVKDQLLYYYNDKCLVYSEDYTIKAIHITIDDNRALLNQLEDIIRNSRKILDLREHNDIVLEHGRSIFSGSNQGVNYSATKSKNYADQENILNEGSTSSSRQSLDNAQSESNDLKNFDKVIPKSNLKQLNQASYERNEGGKIIINKFQQSLEEKKLEEETRPIQYQNYQTQYTEDSNNTITSSNSATVTQNANDSGGLSSNLSVNANTASKSKDKVNIKAYDARIRMWNVRLPNIRREFWHKFQYLFRDEYYY